VKFLDKKETSTELREFARKTIREMQEILLKHGAAMAVSLPRINFLAVRATEKQILRTHVKLTY